MSWALWITGRPGSGKTTVARALAAELAKRGEPAEVLELDALRKTLTPVPTYTDAEREAVYHALVYLAKLLTDARIPVIIDATGHRRAWRDLARSVIPVFAEVQLACPLRVCQARERSRPPGHAPKDIYAIAGRSGATVPGVDVPYEPALVPEAFVDTANTDPATAVARLVPLARALAAGATTRRPRSCVGWALWITGPPGSGKTTLAGNVAESLATRDVTVTIVDVATIRQFLEPAGLQHEAIIHRALVCAAALLTRLGVAVLIDAAAPRRRWRQLAREQIAHYAEVELICPAGICAERARAARWNPPPSPLRRHTIEEDVTDGLAWESSITAELTLQTDVRDLSCVTEDIVKLAWRLHRAAESDRIRPEESMPCASAT